MIKITEGEMTITGSLAEILAGSVKLAAAAGSTIDKNMDDKKKALETKMFVLEQISEAMMNGLGDGIGFMQMVDPDTGKVVSKEVFGMDPEEQKEQES